MATSREIYGKLGLQTGKGGNITIRPWKDVFSPEWGSNTPHGPYKGNSSIKSKSKKKVAVKKKAAVKKKKSKA